MYLAIEINAPGLSIGTLNDKCLNSGDKQDILNQIANIIVAVAAGNIQATVQATSKDASSSITTSGSGSKQVTV